MKSPRTVGYDDFVDQRIQKTRRAVKSSDLVTGLVTLLAWALGLLLLAAAADHWLVAGGFDSWGRFALFAIGLVGGLLYIGTRLGPALIGRVNPLYAAQQIERESPQLKNSLLNLLQLRGNQAGGPAAVHRTLERQAAEGLAAVGETAIDRAGLVRSARIVLALMAAIGIYVVASPKDFFASAGRVLVPWADIAVPSRVQISMLEPGDLELAQGERLEVSALVAGVRESELVELVFSTRDGRLVERRLPMVPRREKSLQYAVSLPTGGGSAAALGLQGDLTYRLEAGDARTRNYEVTVLTAPTIAPVSVTYQYPQYTGFTKREVEGVGDLRALEGTRVTIAAQANLPIDSAQIDLGADGRPDTRMKVDGEQATGSFVLRRDPNSAGDSATNYVLRFTSTDSQANNNPSQYRVEILADLAPEASLLVPADKTIDVAVNQRVRIEVEARDPDFALRGVRLVGETGGKQVLVEKLLTKAFQGKFTSERFVVPRELGLKPGDVLEYWVEAIDNKTPQPNKGESEHKQLRIVGPADNAAGDPEQGEQQLGQGKAQRQPGEGSDEPDAGNQGQPGRNGGQQAKPQSKQPSGGAEQNPDEQSGQGGEQEQPGDQNENPEDQENQDGKSRKPSPDGLRAPGGGGGVGEDEQAESSSSTGGEEGGESGSESGSPQGGGSAGDENGQQPSDNQGGQPGEPGDSSGNRDQQGNDGQSGGDNQDGAGESEAPVPRNGEDDATAFERIREFLKNEQDSGGGREKDRRQQPGDSNSDSDPGQSGEQNQPGRQGDPSERPEGNGERSEADPSDAREGSPNEQGENGQGSAQNDSPQKGSPSSKQQPRDGEAGQQPDRPEEGAGPGEQDRSGQQSDSANSESGGETPPGESTDPQAGPREGTGSSGQSQAADQGAGQSSDQGAGDSTGRPGSQQQSDNPTGESGGEEAGDGSESSASGDKPGGSEQSGDTGGESSEAGGDESGGESGDDKTGGEAGEQGSSEAGEQSGGESGDQGSAQQGSGESSNGESGQPQGDSSKPGEQAGDQPSDGAKPGDSQQGKQPNNESSGDNGQGKSGKATGPPTGKSSQSGTTDTPGDGTDPGGDAANLDYAREQTELVLEELEEQLSKREVDRKLLDKLGWDEQDLRRFVQRWQSRKQQATQRGPAGEAELDQALRNLGLGSGGAKASRKISEDRLRGLRERARQAIPPRLRQATDAYNRSLNALGDDAASDAASK